MKKISFAIIALLATMLFASCNDYETYADQKKKENAAISAYINGTSSVCKGEKVKVITEDEFAAQNNTTDCDKNEFVLFESSGVYMQIVRKGCGKPLQNGETADVLCRFTEYNLLGDSLQLSNNNLYFSSIPEKMSVSNSYGTFSGSFDTSSSIMYSAYSSTSVPSGWLLPLGYINLGRPSDEDGAEIAKVRVVVPSAQGQYYASTNVYPCLYEITYEKGR